MDKDEFIEVYGFDPEDMFGSDFEEIIDEYLDAQVGDIDYSSLIGR